uniref:Protein sleepless n=1 Tax=Rhabditophanes sp. KR3021 TaxID=114890 RepID=A0AC35TQJ1_9BILA
MKVLFTIWIGVSLIKDVDGVSCYECSSSKGQDCKMSASTCQYGLFGCAKITAYSGGVDKFGNFQNGDRSILSVIRSCNMLPFGGVDACQQQSILGVRVVTCYCFSDYCNISAKQTYNLLSMALLLLFSYIII